MNKNHWRISSLFTVFLVCLGLTFMAAPVFQNVHAASAVNIGAADALTDLEKQVKALPDSAFRNDTNREALLNKIDAVINQVGSGAYNGAIHTLETDVKDKITKWMSAPEQAEWIKGIEVTIAAINNASQTTVSTLYGKIAGADAGNNCWVWKGVPYAKPPVGDLRWKAPRDPDRWQRIRQSTRCDVSTQAEMSLLWTPTNKVIGSEDCLYLNIYRPKTDAKNLPVLVWMHGGANVFGGVTRYDGSTLASHSNMIVVFIQYRLGPFGWFYYPALNQDGTPEDTSGNYGTLDTIKAAKWVRDNIGAFGGNPDNITVGGQSAGGFNTQNLLISPLARGLFQRAFIQSAGGGVVPVSTGLDRANATIDKLLAAEGKTRTGMSDSQMAAYLRGKTTNEIERAVMDATGSIPLGTIAPFTDGTVIPGGFADMISAGKYNRMPIVMGSTEYEEKPFLPLFVWRGVFGFLSGGPFSNIFAPPNPPSFLYEDCGKYPSLSWKATMVDSPAKILTEKQEHDVYTFFFKWGGRNDPGSDRASQLAFLYGAGHATDIPFFFGWNNDVYGLTLLNSTNEPGRLALQDAMMSYLGHFAATGNPNGAGLPTWKEWSNIDGGPKSIAFNADNTQAIITMENWGVTKAQVFAQMDGLPAPPYTDDIKKFIKRLISF